MNPAIVRVTGKHSFYAKIYPLDKGCRIEARGRQNVYPTICSGVNELMKMGYVKELTASEIKKLGLENIY